MLLSADYAQPAGMGRFISLFPENFINVGIAEQNLIGWLRERVARGTFSCVSAGLFRIYAIFRAGSPIPRIHEHADHTGRSFSWVCTNIFGNTHFALEDIGLFNCIDNIRVYSPSDGASAVSVFRDALVNQCPAYIRCTGSTNLTPVYSSVEMARSDFNILAQGKVCGDIHWRVDLLCIWRCSRA